MKEVLTRRYKHALAEGEKLPDLILIDGGKGQINIAEKSFGRTWYFTEKSI